jgi:hypothetical protein
VLHQVPDGSIAKSSDVEETDKNVLFDFGAVANIVIPIQELCDRLVTVCVNGLRIVSYPVCVENPKYERNQFIFNFALVIDENEDFSGYSTIVRKLALLFRNLEEQSGFLSSQESGDFHVESPMTIDLNTSNDDLHVKSKIYALCEMVFEDLNHYQECMIPIGKLAFASGSLANIKR